MAGDDARLASELFHRCVRDAPISRECGAIVITSARLLWNILKQADVDTPARVTDFEIHAPQDGAVSIRYECRFESEQQLNTLLSVIDTISLIDRKMDYAYFLECARAIEAAGVALPMNTYSAAIDDSDPDWFNNRLSVYVYVTDDELGRIGGAFMALVKHDG